MKIEILTISMMAIVVPLSTSAQETSKAERRKIERYVDDYYSGLEVVSAFVDQGGKSFDCFPVAKQPALRMVDAQSGKVSFRELVSPTSGQAGGEIPGIPSACPKGAVPVESIQVDDIAAFGSLDAYLSRSYLPVKGAVSGGGGSVAMRTAGDAYALGQAYQSGVAINGGAVGQLDWGNPTLQGNSYASSGAISVWGWVPSGPTYNAVQAGWQKYPDRTGVPYTVFFVNATAAGWSEANCYGLCGWVQTSGSIYPGWSYGGAYLSMSIEHYSGNWYLYVNGFQVGYWTGFSFGSPFGSGSAQGVDVGGYVGGPPGAFGAVKTTTDMGNGSKGATSASALGAVDIRYRTTAGAWLTSATGLPLSAIYNINPCWTAGLWAPTFPHDNHVRFGGPGGNFFGVCP